MSVILITGASTGIGRLTAIATARAGHTVFASMRDITGRNATHAAELRALGAADGIDLRIVELDVLSQNSANAAVASVVEQAGRLDVVVHNAGHLVVGYAEAFTAEDLQHLFDINVFGMQRVNRAALPVLRQQRSGTLLYIGSTSVISVPPFLAPYVASKAAFDALAATTAYEANRFGVESVVVMPGAFTTGTAHFPNATPASDTDRTAALAELEPLMALNEAGTAALFDPSVDSDPVIVAEEVVRVLALPAGQRPRRTVVDATGGDVAAVTRVIRAESDNFVRRMGFDALLQVQL
jgi:NAD(P)-dependent dehydrogenase (short-subunit alcohol dehydrogenase family)